MEMGPVNGQTSSAYSPGPAQSNNTILKECGSIDKGIEEVKGKLHRIGELQRQAIASPDASGHATVNRDLDDKHTEIMTIYRNLGLRIKAIKQQKESGSPTNKNQVGYVDRKLRNAMSEYQKLDRDYRHNLSAQMERQYRIVRPDASEQEVREAVEDTGSTQIFSQAVSINHYHNASNCLTDKSAYVKQSTRPSFSSSAGCELAT